MQATLTINSRGVITLPVKLRQSMGLQTNDQLIAETTPQGLLLRPAVTLPLEIYSPARVEEFDELEAELAAVCARADPGAMRNAQCAMRNAQCAFFWMPTSCFLRLNL